MSAAALLLTCEHAGNRVPARYRNLFRSATAALQSHRGWDPGALPLARALARRLAAPLLFTTWTRLLVEVNRSLHHPQLWSRYTRDLPPAERRAILDTCYHPHRDAVTAALRQRLKRAGRGGTVLHVGVHSFTPVLDGVARACDIGLLYDPRRPAEQRLCQAWAAALRAARPDLRVRRNYPYRGAADGLTTHLRGALGQRYLGIELEVSQAALRSDVPGLADLLAGTLTPALGVSGRIRRRAARAAP